MISELYGKISRTDSNLSDRMEDKLTGDRLNPLTVDTAPLIR